MTGYRHDIEKLAYAFWEERGRPYGSPEVDWFQAEQERERTAQGWAWSEMISESTSETTSEAVFENEGGHVSGEGAGVTTSQSRGESRSTSA
jgi:hypothetical protein